METWKILTVTRGDKDKSGNKGEGLLKEHVGVTHGHGQQCGN